MRSKKWLVAAAAPLAALAAFIAVSKVVSTRGQGGSSASIPRSGLCCGLPPAIETQTIENSGAVSKRITLDPMQFIGPVRQAYIIAEQKPDLLMQLHCYCGCDRQRGHKSLLDCYKDNHSASCETCIGEALLANRMFDQGSTVEQIRAAIEARFRQD